VAATGDDTLLDERSRRPQAAVASIAAGILTISGGAIAAWVYSDLPTVPVLDALRERFDPHPPQPGLKALQVRWYDANAVKLILVSVVLALAAAAIGLALSHLYRSVKARRPELPPYVVYAAIAGAVLVAISGIVQAIGVTAAASSFASAPRETSSAARDVLQGPVIVAALVLRQVGVFALGFAFVLLALNGMRVGLLTRFMGVLGIIVGVLFIIPIGSSLPIVQAFWLAALGALFLGRWPSRMPPAWVTGQAQPWPSQQELREARMERQADEGEAPSPRLARMERQADEGEAPSPRRAGRRERAEPPETPAPELPAPRPHPSSKKRKRKRR
jgi:MFS family permease